MMMFFSTSTKTTIVSAVLSLLLLGTSSILHVDAYFCPDNCEPFGKCVKGECHCHPGFDGMDCSFPYVYCPDGITTCFNGATCKPTSTHPDQMTGNIQYECDCSTAYGESFVEGSQCEHPQSEVCEESDINDVVKKSEYAFCTNGGKCKEYVKKGKNHAGCICDHTNFEGRHCQYEKGRAPREELKIANKRDNDDSSSSIKVHHTGTSAFIKFLIVIIVGGVIGYFTIITYRKYIITTQSNDHTRVEETLRDLKLTASTDDMDDNEDGLNDHNNDPSPTRSITTNDDEWNIEAVKVGTLT